MEKAQYVCITGASGAGKGTLCKQLKKTLTTLDREVIFLETGQLVRNRILAGDQFAQNMQKINDQSLRQPAIVPASLWLDELYKDGASPMDKIIIHDGSPRSFEEFKMLHSLAGRYIPECLRIFCMTGEPDILRTRLLEAKGRKHRSDTADKESIERKMSWNAEATTDLVVSAGHFLGGAMHRNIITQINTGDMTPEEVYEKFMEWFML